MATDIGKVDMSNVSTVGAKNVSRSQLQNLRTGTYGDLIVSEMYGKYGELVKSGYVFAARVATAAAIPVNTTLTNSPTLWNTASSGKLVIPLKILISPTAIGTPVLTGFTICYLLNAGDAVATAAPVVTFTNIAPVNLLLGRGSVASTKFSGATVTFTTQPAILYDIGMGHWIEGTAATGLPYLMAYDFDSTLMMPPGTLISIGATAATSTTFNTTIIFAELPAPVDY
jgi:hypothetical protein